MSIFSNWSGGQSRKDLAGGAAAAQGRYDNSAATYGQQYGKATGRFDQFAQSGASADKLYGNYLGANGGDAQRDAFSGYQEGPFANFDRDRITQANARSMNARGMGGSGTEALASARALNEYGQQGLNTYLNRLQGLQGQGMQAANALSGLDMGYAGGIAGINNQRAQTDKEFASAMAGTRSMGLQNTLGAVGALGGLAFAGMTPGAGGLSALGNMGNMMGFGRGANALNYQGR